MVSLAEFGFYGMMGFTADIVINHKQFIHFKVTDTNGYGPGSPPFMLALLMYLH